MHGIVSGFRTKFSPTVTADMIIKHAAAKGLANEIAPESMSSTAKVIIGVMSALTGVITLPLFVRLHDFIQQSYYVPEERKLLAQLGCKAATAQIVDGDQANERRVKIELGEKDDPYTALYFIERERTDGREGTQCVVQDYTGAELPCPEEFSTLEEVIEFYKKDLAEDTDGIYSQNVSKDLFIHSTLGVALAHYGSDQFDEHDLSNFKKLFGLPKDYFIELKALQNPVLELGNAFCGSGVDCLLSMVEQRPNLNDWDRNSTDHLLSMVYHGLSDGMLSVYQHIFTEETLKKYVSLADEFFSLCQQYNNPPRKNPPSSSFTKEFTLSDNTKVTLKHYGRDDFRRSKDYNDIPRVELTIADKMQCVGSFIIEDYIADLVLQEKDKNSQNYAAIRGVQTQASPLPSNSPT